MPSLLSVRTLPLLLLLTVASAALATTVVDRPANRDEVRLSDHQNPAWDSIRAHLPDPAVATVAQLELAADILRARRFIADAMDFYEYAMRRGGDQVEMLNKLGICSLELRNIPAAKVYFQQAVRLQKKNAEGWNNLGAIEYLTGRYSAAVSNYKKAIKYDKHSATYHSNLGTAYFEQKDFDSSRKEYEAALKLDPDLLKRHSSTGVTARMLSPADHARFCYEMARLYGKRGEEEAMLHYLTMAVESGFDVLEHMTFDDSLARYRKDPRVLLIVRNAQEIRSRASQVVAGATAPPLPPASASK